VSDSETIRNHAAFIWGVADLLRGDYKQSEYGKVVLPLTVIRRLDCVLEPTKQAVLERQKQLAGRIENLEPVLQTVARQQYCDTSPLLGASSNARAEEARTRCLGLSRTLYAIPRHTRLVGYGRQYAWPAKREGSRLSP
jgi:type I restriction-modification system DNA methylase subunit